jgi:hypothetical protein
MKHPLLAAAATLILFVTVFATPIRRQEYGTIYFYRVKERAKTAVGGKSAYVYLDGKKILSMTEERFIGLRLPPRRYIIKLKTKATETPVNVEPGKTYYFRVSKTVQSGYVYDLIKIETDQAIYQMRDLLPLEDKNVSDKSLSALKDRPTPP